MKNKNYFVVFDLETDGSNPFKDNPIQFAAVVVDPRSLTVVPGSDFSSWCKPEEADDEDYYEKHKSTIDWHANNFGVKPEEFLAKIKGSPTEKEVWKNFVEYLKQWHIPGKAKNKFNAPILAGYNIFEFDKIFIDRLSIKYKNVDKEGFSNIYRKRDTVDILKLVFAWSEDLTVLPDYKMDTLRDAFGINHAGIAHEGLKDCYDEAALLIKYLNLHRVFSKRVKGWK